MKALPFLGLILFVTTSLVLARGGGDGGGFRGEAPRLDEDGVDASIRADDVDLARTSGDNYRVSDVNVRPEGEDTANVNVRTADGQDYDVNVAGPDGYRTGYVWQNGDYVAVDCHPWAPYPAPYGVWAGWNVVTQPDYVQYPVYATYPVETAVEVALQKLGLYDGPIDGNASSVASAIE